MRNIAGRHRFISALLPLALFFSAAQTESRAAPGAGQFTDRLIVKFKPGIEAGKRGKLQPEFAAQLSELAGMELTYFRDMTGGAKVMRLPQSLPLEQATRITERIATDPGIDYAEPDQRMYPTLVPTDPGYVNQWHLNDLLGGINAPGAWDITTGSANTVVAVLDSGITPHPDLQARMLPGYDFITDIARANDGDARDADPSDPGNWLTAADQSITQFADCPVRNSSWHGTMVSGTIGAIALNNSGGVGIDWQAKILPVRVLGKCGGFTSDIAEAMLWAAGLSVSGIADNPTPAKILNLSLGSAGTCRTTYQRSIDLVVNAGKIVVVAAGNDNLSDSGALSTCTGIINVAATGRSGGKAGYSNFGGTITLAAPGGDGGGLFVTTGNTGTTTPGQATTVGTTGTSFAAPTVSGVIALMVAISPDMDARTATRILQASARPFPDPTCTTVTCGAGIVDAAAAVRLTRDQNFGVASFVGFADADVNLPNTDIALKVTNHGANGTSTVSAGVVAGANDFSVAANGCAAAPLGVGAICHIYLRFNPNAPGQRSGTLNLAAGGANFSLGLTGNGYATTAVVQRSAAKSGGPLYITRSNDGRFWYTNSVANSIGRMTVDGPITEFALPTAAANPFDIAAGADGNVWFTQLDGNRIGRITPAGVISEFTVPTAASQPRGIAPGADGNMWFTQISGARIGRITPAGVITEFVIPWAQASPRGISAGPDGNLWFTDSGARVVGRLTPSGTFTSFTIPWTSVDVRAIRAGPDGNMWFVESTGNRVGRVTMSGVMTSFALPRLGAAPLSITEGPDNAMWYSASGVGRIGRIDPATGQITEYRMPTAGSAPIGLVGGANNSLWVASSNNNSVIALALNGTNGLLPSTVKRGVFDIDADGKSELLLREGSSQLQAGRLLNHTFQYTSLADPGGNFRLLGVGDFNGNGRADLAFQNMTQAGEFGDVRAWPDFNRAGEVFWRQVKKVWDVQAVGDLDGDGLADLVWRYVVRDSPDTGVSYVWFSNGGGVAQVRKRGGAPLDWTLLGAADINDDGAADMVYISPGNVVRVLMATANRTCANLAAGTIPAGFNALKLADFSGRRKADILIRNPTTGEVRLLLLDAAGLALPDYTGAPDDQNASCTASALTVAQTTVRMATVDVSSTFYASGDFNGDGIVDILWLASDNVLSLWKMNPNGAAPVIVGNAGGLPVNTTALALQ